MKITYHRYHVTVNIAGSPLHQVPKENVSAPEISILRGLHGADAVIVKHVVGRFRAEKTTLRDHLIRVYGHGAVNHFLGPESAQLPDEAPITVIPESVRVSVSRVFDGDDEEEMIEAIDKPTQIGAAVGFSPELYEGEEAVDDVPPPPKVKANEKAAATVSA